MASSCSSENNGCASCAPQLYLFSIQVTSLLDMNQISYTCTENGNENNPPTCYANYSLSKAGQYSENWESPCDENNIANNSTNRAGSYSLTIGIKGAVTADGDVYGNNVLRENGTASFSRKQTLWPDFGCSSRGSEDWTENSSYSLMQITDSCGNVQNVAGMPIYTASKSRIVKGPDGSSSLETINGCRNIFDEAGNFIEAVAEYYLQECGFLGCQEYTGLIQCGIPYCVYLPYDGPLCQGDPILGNQISMGTVESLVSNALNKQIQKAEINAPYSCANKKIVTGRTNFCGNPGKKDDCWSIGSSLIDNQTFNEETLIANRSFGRVENSLYKHRICLKKNDLSKNIKSISGKVYFYVYDTYLSTASPCCNDDFDGNIVNSSSFTINLSSSLMIKDNIEYLYSDLDYVFNFLEISKSYPEKWIGLCTSIEKVEYF